MIKRSIMVYILGSWKLPTISVFAQNFAHWEFPQSLLIEHWKLFLWNAEIFTYLSSTSWLIYVHSLGLQSIQEHYPWKWAIMELNAEMSEWPQNLRTVVFVCSSPQQRNRWITSFWYCLREWNNKSQCGMEAGSVGKPLRDLAMTGKTVWHLRPNCLWNRNIMCWYFLLVGDSRGYKETSKCFHLRYGFSKFQRRLEKWNNILFVLLWAALFRRRFHIIPGRATRNKPIRWRNCNRDQRSPRLSEPQVPP